MCTLLKQLDLLSLEFGLCRLILAGLPEPHRLCEGRMSAGDVLQHQSLQTSKHCSTIPQCHRRTSWHWAGFYGDTSSLYLEGREVSVITCLGIKQGLFLLLLPAEGMCIHSAVAHLQAVVSTQFFCPTPVGLIFLLLNLLVLSSLAHPDTNTWAKEVLFNPSA